MDSSIHTNRKPKGVKKKAIPIICVCKGIESLSSTMDNVETITNIVNVGYLGVAPCTKIIRHVDASSLFYYPYIYMVIADDKY